MRITLPLAEGVTERLDALAGDDETRLDVIRAGIDQEIKRRERLTAKQKTDHDT